MRNLGQMMKQAQQMQSKMAEMQEKLAEMEVEGQSGGGMVNVLMDGKMTLKRLKIDPSLVDPNDVEMLEDLIVAAVGDGKKKAEARIQEKMAEVTGGMNLPPDFKLPF